MSSLSATRFLSVKSPGSPRSATILQLYPYLLATIIMLYFVLSTPVLLLLGWDYSGGGPAFENIHPATYLLVAALCASLSIDRTFRWRVVGRIASDPSLVSFVLAVVITAAYANFIQGASAAPFVDTFFAAIMATIIVTCIAEKPLTFLRGMIDIFFVVNILVIFLEFISQRSFLPTYVLGAGGAQGMINVLGAQETAASFSRASAFFGHPLNAGTLLGVYCITNLVSMPVRLSVAGIGRLLLSLMSYVAIFPTGSRSSLVITTIVALLYLIYRALASGLRGRVNRVGLAFGLATAVIVVPLCVVLWSTGVFDPTLDRFQNDYGSALSRSYALEILGHASASDLWFGRPLQDVLGFQQSFGLIAIEISWINFILVGGLITTIPLFITYTLFLFRSTWLYCSSGILFVSMVLFVDTAASNGIWSKTSVLTTSLVVAISYLRRDVLGIKVFGQR
jgi:hypothetical protein